MKTILLSPDTENWSWGKRARSLQKYAPEGFEVDIVPQRHLTPDMPSKYDGTLIFSWPDSPCCDDRCWTFVANEGCCFPYDPNAANYVHRTASKYKNRHTAAKRIPRYRGVITINHRTVDFLKSLNPNTHLLRTGVDTDVFQPLRSVRTEPPYRIGWCGKAFDDPAKWTPKGYHEVLLPLMERFRGDERIEWVINRRDSSNALSEAEMVRWYNDIDLFLCTSAQEGTPSTLLESMACGRGFVSTDVGIAEDLFWDSGDLDSSKQFIGFAGIKPYATWTHDDETAKAVDILYQSLEVVIRLNEPSLFSPLARKTVETHYNWNTLAEQWLTIIIS